MKQVENSLDILTWSSVQKDIRCLAWKNKWRFLWYNRSIEDITQECGCIFAKVISHYKDKPLSHQKSLFFLCVANYFKNVSVNNNLNKAEKEKHNFYIDGSALEILAECTEEPYTGSADTDHLLLSLLSISPKKHLSKKI